MLKCIKMTPLQLHHNSTVYITLSLSVMKNNSVYFSYQEFLRRQFQPIANFRIKTFLRCEEHVVLLLNILFLSLGLEPEGARVGLTGVGGEERRWGPCQLWQRAATAGSQSVRAGPGILLFIKPSLPPSSAWDLNCFDIWHFQTWGKSTHTGHTGRFQYQIPSRPCNTNWSLKLNIIAGIWWHNII